MLHMIDLATHHSHRLALKRQKSTSASRISLEKALSTSTMAAIGYPLPWTERL
jgi:hypothetical protein